MTEGTAVQDPGQPDPRDEVRGLERRLYALQARAAALAEDHGRTRREREEVAAFLELAPAASQRMEALTEELLGRVLQEIEVNLTHAVREVMGQERTVHASHEVKGNTLHVAFSIENQGKREDILRGQGGSVCNVISVGLRLIAISQLDPALHRPFLVLDEQDCWLKPELVPGFMKLVTRVARRLGLQALVISHHPPDHFAARADKAYAIAPSRERGVVLMDMKADEA